MLAKKIKKSFNDFGEERIDNYFWMRDKKNSEVLDYVKYENSLTNKYFKSDKNLQEKIFKELKSRKRDNDKSVPYFYNGYWYIKNFKKGKEYPIVSRKKASLMAKTEEVLDQNKLAKGKKYFNIGAAVISPDNRYLAYAEDLKADKRYTIKFKDLTTGKLIKDKIFDTSDSFLWGNDSKTIFYVDSDKVTLRPNKVKRHVLGAIEDVVVFEEKKEIYYLGLSKTRSEEFIVIDVGSHDHVFQYYFKSDGNIYPPKIFQKPKKGIIYKIDHREGCWYILTNLKAIDFEIFKTEEDRLNIKHWKSFIKPKEGVRYNNFILFKNYFVYEEFIAGVPYFKILDLKTKKIKTIKFKETLYGGGFLFNPEYNSDKLRISFESMKDPETEYEYDMRSGKLKVLKVNKPKGNYNKEDYVVERKWVKSRDGVKIPLSLFYKKNIRLDGSNPCMIYGYGSYGHTLTQDFNENILSLVNRGVIYAVAHIRGGQEMGRRWYLDGKLLKKINTFNDFIDCAEFLIDKKYTNKEKLVARGGSAGGLLMGAVANMRPDLFKGMIFQVPFVDVVNTMMDASIPLTTGEYVEWGNPNKKNYFQYIKSYSPYDNIKKQNYPAIFIDSGFNDTQVHYWEPLKYIAKMKDFKTDNNPILLHMDLDTGHGGKSGRFSYLVNVAVIYSFILKLVGINK